MSSSGIFSRPIRRIVTDHDATGRSVFRSDEQ